MLAANKTPVMSYHFAWPGYGHVVKAGDGFRYYRRADADDPLSAADIREPPLAGSRRPAMQ